MGNGFCFWHDPVFDKSGLELKDKLERYAASGGLMHGLQLKRANLRGLNLVRHKSNSGYDLSWSDLYRANLSGAHLFNLKMHHGSLMKTDLSESNLHCADLTDTNLLGVKLTHAKIDNICVGERLSQENKATIAIQHHKTDEAHDLFEQSEEIYRALRKASEEQGLFELAGNYIHRELKMRRMQYPIFSRKRVLSKFVDLLCGYGEKPANVILFSICLIVLCACFYFITGVKAPEGFISFNAQISFTTNITYFLKCLYFSVVTFTTLGYGDITPIGLSRLIAAIEAFIGNFTLALFVVVFVKKMTR